MLYHRNSLNCRPNILVVRRLLGALLVIPGATSLIQWLLSTEANLLPATGSSFDSTGSATSQTWKFSVR